MQVVCDSVDADTLVLALVMFLSFFGLNWRIGQQERLVRENLNNGVRGDVKRLDEKLDAFSLQLATMQGEQNAHHGHER